MDEWRKKSVMVFCLMVIAMIVIVYAGVSYYQGNESEYTYGMIEDKIEYAEGLYLTMDNGDILYLNNLEELGNNPLEIGSGFVYYKSIVVGNVNN